jgi:molecular chaperone IbpA
MLNSPFDNQYPNRKRKWEEEHRISSAQIPPVKPRPITVEDLFPRIDRWGIGFDGIFRTLSDFDTKAMFTYPPHNITKFNDGKWQVEMAVAGFRKDDIEIKVKDKVMTVSSDVQDPEETFGEVIHHGIAQRNFTTNFALGEYVEVESAEMKDGILTIKLFTNIPDEKKPKVIDIN